MTLRFKCMLILVILTLCFIWGNSMLSSEQSAHMSDAVTEWMGGIPSDEQPTPDAPWFRQDHLIVRKSAHLLEFMLLGCELALLMGGLALGYWHRIGVLAFCGLLCSLVDETIQIFSHRTAAIVDVWIDILGYTVGCLLAMLILRWSMYYRAKIK